MNSKDDLSCLCSLLQSMRFFITQAVTKLEKKSKVNTIFYSLTKNMV